MYNHYHIELSLFFSCACVVLEDLATKTSFHLGPFGTYSMCVYRLYSTEI